MDYKSKRNGEIEFLRFLFCIVIFLYHSGLCMPRGYLGVEFFFMVSGAFMAKTLYTTKDSCRHEPVSVTLDETNRYVFRRIKAFYPYFLVSSLIGAVVDYIDNKTVCGGNSFLMGDLFLLTEYGYTTPRFIHNVIWYLSAMLFATWLIYPLLRRYYDITVHISPVIYLIISGIFLMLYGQINSLNVFIYDMISTGFLRAIAGMSLGIFVFKMSLLLKNKIGSSPGRRDVITVVEMLMWIYLLVYMALYKAMTNGMDGYAIIVMAGALTIAMSEQTGLSTLLSRKPVYFLGKFSVVLFMNHLYWLQQIDGILFLFGIKTERHLSVTIAFCVSVSVSLLVMLTVYLIRKIIKSKTKPDGGK